MLKSTLVNKDFQPWLLIGWWLCCRPIRVQIWKFSSTNMNLTWHFKVIQTPELLEALGTSGTFLQVANPICKWVLVMQNSDQKLFRLRVLTDLVHCVHNIISDRINSELVQINQLASQKRRALSFVQIWAGWKTKLVNGMIRIRLHKKTVKRIYWRLCRVNFWQD